MNIVDCLIELFITVFYQTHAEKLANIGKFEHPTVEVNQLKQGENIFWSSNGQNDKGQNDPGSVSNLNISAGFLALEILWLILRLISSHGGESER